MPERVEREVHKVRYINTLTFTFTFAVIMCTNHRLFSAYGNVCLHSLQAADPIAHHRPLSTLAR